MQVYKARLLNSLTPRRPHRGIKTRALLRLTGFPSRSSVSSTFRFGGGDRARRGAIIGRSFVSRDESSFPKQDCGANRERPIWIRDAAHESDYFRRTSSTSRGKPAPREPLDPAIKNLRKVQSGDSEDSDDTSIIGRSQTRIARWRERK